LLFGHSSATAGHESEHISALRVPNHLAHESLDARASRAKTVVLRHLSPDGPMEPPSHPVADLGHVKATVSDKATEGVAVARGHRPV
jgi:hypothetical protein